LIRFTGTLLLLATLVVTGCNGGGNSNAPARNSNTNSVSNDNSPPLLGTDPIKPKTAVDPKFKTCNPYYPLVPGSLVRYSLVWSSGLVADATIVVDQEVENGRPVYVQTTQILDKTAGSNKNERTTMKYVCDGDRIQLIHWYTENQVDGAQSIVEFQFKATAVAMLDVASLKRKGSTWGYGMYQTFRRPGAPPAALEDPTIVNFQVEGEEKITVPAGTFTAIKIVRRVGKISVTEHYVAGLGMVKRFSDEGTFWQLKEYSGLAPIE
jgi:hypothetical protein